MTKQNRADVAKRLVAATVDLVMSFIAWRILSWILPWSVGNFVASLAICTFLLLRDAEGIGKSPGKFLAGLSTTMRNGQVCDHIASIKRNLSVASFYLTYTVLLLIVPFLPGLGHGFAHFVACVVGLLTLGLKLGKIIDNSGQRLGDLLADTVVIDISIS